MKAKLGMGLLLGTMAVAPAVPVRRSRAVVCGLAVVLGSSIPNRYGGLRRPAPHPAAIGPARPVAHEKLAALEAIQDEPEDGVEPDRSRDSQPTVS